MKCSGFIYKQDGASPDVSGEKVPPSGALRYSLGCSHPRGCWFCAVSDGKVPPGTFFLKNTPPPPSLSSADLFPGERAGNV